MELLESRVLLNVDSVSFDNSTCTIDNSEYQNFFSVAFSNASCAPSDTEHLHIAPIVSDNDTHTSSASSSLSLVHSVAHFSYKLIFSEHTRHTSTYSEMAAHGALDLFAGPIRLARVSSIYAVQYLTGYNPFWLLMGQLPNSEQFTKMYKCLLPVSIAVGVNAYLWKDQLLALGNGLLKIRDAGHVYMDKILFAKGNTTSTAYADALINSTHQD